MCEKRNLVLVQAEELSLTLVHDFRALAISSKLQKLSRIKSAGYCETDKSETGNFAQVDNGVQNRHYQQIIRDVPYVHILYTQQYVNIYFTGPSSIHVSMTNAFRTTCMLGF